MTTGIFCVSWLLGGAVSLIAWTCRYHYRDARGLSTDDYLSYCGDQNNVAQLSIFLFWPVTLIFAMYSLGVAPLVRLPILAARKLGEKHAIRDKLLITEEERRVVALKELERELEAP